MLLTSTTLVDLSAEVMFGDVVIVIVVIVVKSIVPVTGVLGGITLSSVNALIAL